MLVFALMRCSCSMFFTFMKWLKSAILNPLLFSCCIHALWTGLDDINYLMVCGSGGIKCPDLMNARRRNADVKLLLSNKKSYNC